MRYSELVDQAHQHLAMMGGMNQPDRLRLLRLMERMVETDWDVLETAVRPTLSLVAGS